MTSCAGRLAAGALQSSGGRVMTTKKTKAGYGLDKVRGIFAYLMAL